MTPHQIKLNEAWDKKYPNGMGYFIRFKDNSIRYGVLSERPTSRTQCHYWKVGKGYVGKTYFAVKTHKIFPI